MNTSFDTSLTTHYGKLARTYAFIATAAFLSLWFGEAVNLLAPSLGYDTDGMRMKATVLSDPAVALHLFAFWCLLFFLGVWWRSTRAIVFYAGRISEDAITMLLGAFFGLSLGVGLAGYGWTSLAQAMTSTGMATLLSVVVRKLIAPDLDRSITDRVWWSIAAFAGFVAIGFSFI